MEVNPGVPQNHFDLVLSIYGLGWTTDLRATLALVNTYLRPGGCLVVSGEHPVYSCLEWNGAQYAVSVPYFTEGPREHTSWKGVPIVIQRRTLGTFVGQIIQAGLRDRSVRGDTTQSCGRERKSRRSRALVLCSSGKRDADHVHHQGTEAVRVADHDTTGSGLLAVVLGLSQTVGRLGRSGRGPRSKCNDGEQHGASFGNTSNGSTSVRRWVNEELGCMNRTARRFGASSIALVLVAGAIATTTAQTRPAEPLSIARQGYVFAGGKYSTVNGRQVMSGQLYAEFQIPARQSHPWPIVMIHGGVAVGNQLHRNARWPRGLGAVLPAAGLRDLRGRSARPGPGRVPG